MSPFTAPAPAPIPAASVSPQIADQLSQLRDIRLPHDPSWWPLAPGWWMVAGVLVVAVCVAIVVIVLQKRTLKYTALRELEELRQQKLPPLTITELATEVSVLLRRVTLQRQQEKSLAQAHSDAWQAFLMASPHGMSPLVAQLIASAPYQPAETIDKLTQTTYPTPRELLDAAKIWIRRHA